ncbi:hypothetical protein BYT27DRAFT_7264885 [Phlegmacium glaucopus]|nr:hypothetical protein BYT27DRAFT_7264885 [Phlegmacium glaucopus]
MPAQGLNSTLFPVTSTYDWVLDSSALLAIVQLLDTSDVSHLSNNFEMATNGVAASDALSTSSAVPFPCTFVKTDLSIAPALGSNPTASTGGTARTSRSLSDSSVSGGGYAIWTPGRSPCSTE